MCREKVYLVHNLELPVQDECPRGNGGEPVSEKTTHITNQEAERDWEAKIQQLPLRAWPQWPKDIPLGPTFQQSTVIPNATTQGTTLYTWTFGEHYHYSNHRRWTYSAKAAMLQNTMDWVV
jgi:hypothetical protein